MGGFTWTEADELKLSAIKVARACSNQLSGVVDLSTLQQMAEVVKQAIEIREVDDANEAWMDEEEEEDNG
jgi:hypothetical protein